MADLVDLARDRLKQVIDPEVGVNIVDLGLIYDLVFDKDGLRIVMTFTSESCPLGPQLVAEAERVLCFLPGTPNVTIAVTFDPPWSPERITPDGRAWLQR